MRIARLSGEQNLSELVRSLYEIRGPQSARVAREAEAALLKANPHLREPGIRLSGSMILVPDLPGISPGPAPDVEPIAMPGRKLVDDTRAAVVELQKRLEDAGKRAEEEGRQTAELLKSEEVQALERFPAVRDALPAIRNATQARFAELEALKTFQNQTLPELLGALEALSKRLG